MYTIDWITGAYTDTDNMLNILGVNKYNKKPNDLQICLKLYPSYVQHNSGSVPI